MMYIAQLLLLIKHIKKNNWFKQYKSVYGLEYKFTKQ